jgi:hypothetical protein
LSGMLCATHRRRQPAGSALMAHHGATESDLAG